MVLWVAAAVQAQTPAPRPGATGPVPVPAERTAQPITDRRVATSPATSRKGEIVCRDPRLIGTSSATITGRYPGCLILDPVRVTEIAGIRLSTPAVLECRTARTLANWLSGIAQPAARESMQSRISELWIMGSYACRSRNNRAGARLSEHSVGRAIDIGGLTLADGRKLTVLGDWGKGVEGRLLASLWRKACGTFATVLGPGADKHHRDHLHLDTSHRGSDYCR